MSTQTALPASPFLNAPSYEASPEPPRGDELTQALALEMTRSASPTGHTFL